MIEIIIDKIVLALIQRGVKKVLQENGSVIDPLNNYRILLEEEQWNFINNDNINEIQIEITNRINIHFSYFNLREISIRTREQYFIIINGYYI